MDTVSACESERASILREIDGLHTTIDAQSAALAAENADTLKLNKDLALLAQAEPSETAAQLAVAHAALENTEVCIDSIAVCICDSRCCYDTSMK